MDRDRLKEVQQTDLTDSKLNQEFVDWLRNKGPTWLLAVLVALVAWLGWDKFQEARASRKSAAFFDYDSATKAESLQIVAEEHEGIESVPHLARLRAADMHYYAVQTKTDPDDPSKDLTPEEVESHRSQAADLYRAVLESTKGDPQRLLFVIQAHFGLAAIAESTGNLDEARAQYDAVAQAAGTIYPSFVAQSQKRKETLDSLASVAELPSRESVPRPSPIDPLLRDLLEPPAEQPS